MGDHGFVEDRDRALLGLCIGSNVIACGPIGAIDSFRKERIQRKSEQGVELMLITIFEENRYFLVDLSVDIDSNLPKLDRLGIRRARFGLNLSL